MDGAKIWESLVASGPLALCLGFAVWKLWAALETERRDNVTFLKSLLKKPDDSEQS